MLLWVRYASRKVPHLQSPDERVSFGADSVTSEAGTFEYYHPLPHPPPIRAYIRLCGPVDERWVEMFACFKSSEIPYKNRCLICQFAMWVPGSESSGAAGLPLELPRRSCRTATGATPPELPDCHRSSPLAPAAVRQLSSSWKRKGVQSLSPPCRGSIWTSESQSQSSFSPNFSQPW